MSNRWSCRVQPTLVPHTPMVPTLPASRCPRAPAQERFPLKVPTMMMRINMIHFRRASGRWAAMAVLFVVAVAVVLRPGAAPPANAAAAPADTGHGGDVAFESVPG